MRQELIAEKGVEVSLRTVERAVAPLRRALRAEAKATLFEYIEVFYNGQRLHSSLGDRTPIEAREDMTAALAE